MYLGFGSMPAPEPEVLVKMAIELTKQAKCRAILCAGWSGVEQVAAEVPPELLIIKEAPHDYLFPRYVVLILAWLLTPFPLLIITPCIMVASEGIAGHDDNSSDDCISPDSSPPPPLAGAPRSSITAAWCVLEACV